MYIIQRTAFLVLLFHQCIVNGFNIFNMDTGFNYLNREMNSITSSPDIETRWITQELDHFNSKDSRNFQMKYFESLRFWEENGPIYMFLGIERFSESFWAAKELMKELAKETHGAMYLVENRYSGDSKPFLDLNAENMKYFSSRQTLADVAKLISYLKSLPVYKDSKVVVIGCVYSGNLAAWMKVLYPTLVDAAISSSAPVLAQKDFFEYLEKVKNNMERYGGTRCLDKINKKILNYDSQFQSPEGIKQLKKDEGICDANDMTILENKQLFFFIKTWLISICSGDLYLIQTYCDIGAPTANDKNNNSRFLNKYLKVNNSDGYCINFDFKDFIQNIKDTRNLMSRYLDLYQHCTEFGQFPTTSSKNQPFLNIPLEFYIKICSSLFGNSFNEKRVDEGVDFTNKLYGGLKPNVTKVVFINGDIEPMSTLGIFEDLSLDAQAVVIPRERPCEVLFPDSNYDSEELQEARKYVKYLIKKWIGAGEF